MNTKNNGKRYNDDFKSMVVDLYHSGSSVKDLSSEYGVSNVTIGSTSTFWTQKRIKYGLPSTLSVILYELGFTDRVISIDLCSVLSSSGRLTRRNVKKNKGKER